MRGALTFCLLAAVVSAQSPFGFRGHRRARQWPGLWTVCDHTAILLMLLSDNCWTCDTCTLLPSAAQLRFQVWSIFGFWPLCKCQKLQSLCSCAGGAWHPTLLSDDHCHGAPHWFGLLNWTKNTGNLQQSLSQAFLLERSHSFHHARSIVQ